MNPSATYEDNERFQADQAKIKREIDADSWNRLGFDPHSLIHYDDTVEFTLDDVKRSLFNGTPESPESITFNVWVGLQDVQLPVVVDSVRQVWNMSKDLFGRHQDAAYIDRPDWVIEGWIVGTAVPPYLPATRVRAHLVADDHERFDYAYLQRVRDPRIRTGSFDVIS